MNTNRQAWTLTIDHTWIAWLTFDLPGSKVNKFTAEALVELESLVEQLAGDEAIRAVAIRSGKPDSFIVGADIDELARLTDESDARAKAAAGHRVFDALAALPVPSVAVIHGACLGGGLEMALACTYRLVTNDPKTSLGAPEVNLGIIPGWGGTQRLPRLVGLVRALPMIVAGKPLGARQARRTGLADGEITPAFLESQTREFVDRVLTRDGKKSVLRRRRRARPLALRALEAIAPARAFVCRRARLEVMRKTLGSYPAPLEAVDVLRRTAGRRRDDGAQTEIDAFVRLALTPISRNLVRIFQASQRMKKTGPEAPPQELRAAAVVGAGIMGGGIAWALSGAGLRVRLKDVSWNAVAAGLASASGAWAPLVKRRRMTPGAMNLAMHRISGTIDYSGFKHADVVIEAVVEDVAIKQRVLREIEAHVSPDAFICSNTSSLPLKDLAAVLDHPKRFVGLHFFNPVNRMQLVEVVAAKRTARETVGAMAELVRRMGKVPVIVGDCPGFLVNRILLSYLIESTWMFEEGLGVERIDGALERFGMPMGPLALVDEVGIDVGYKVAKLLESAYGERMHVAGVLGGVVETGDLKGRKSGRGFYLYGEKSKKPNGDLAHLAGAARERDGVVERDLAEDEIVDRAVLIMVNEAARCLDERVVDDAEVLDMAMVMGTGFAPFRGGLLRYADERGLGPVCDRLDELAERYGERFRPVPYLERLARKGRGFYAPN